MLLFLSSNTHELQGLALNTSTTRQRNAASSFVLCKHWYKERSAMQHKKRRSLSKHDMQLLRKINQPLADISPFLSLLFLFPGILQHESCAAVSGRYDRWCLCSGRYAQQSMPATSSLIDIRNKVLYSIYVFCGAQRSDSGVLLLALIGSCDVTAPSSIQVSACW